MDFNFLTIILIILGILILLALIKAVQGPKFTDRLIAIDAINTMIIVVIVIVSQVLPNSDYLIDVAIIYALLGFTANVLIMKLLQNKYNKKKILHGDDHGKED